MQEFLFFRYTPILLIIFFLTACSSQEELLQQRVQEQLQQTQKGIQSLATALDNQQIRNANILIDYSKKLAQSKPEFAQLATQLAQDATPQGPLFQGLKQRLNLVESQLPNSSNYETVLLELGHIKEAASSSLFGDALSDPINVIADLGQFPRVNAISREAEIANSQTEDFGAGSQLIGNNNYGQWSTGSNGLSFWEWYGVYSLFSNISRFSNPIGYDRWGRSRGYSYHNDFGYSRYTSPKQKQQQQRVLNQTKKTYATQGKKFTSPYAKKRHGASGLSRSSHTPAKTQSSYSKKSSYAKQSSYSGNQRSSSSRSSRGLSRGK